MTHRTHTSELPAGSSANRAAIWAFIIAGIGIVAATVTFAGLRIAALLGESRVPFTTELAGNERALSEVGRDSAVTDVVASSITFTLDTVPAGVLAPAIIEQSLLVITVTAVIACLIQLAQRTLRGHLFSKSNTKIAATAAITGLVGFGLAPAFGSIAGHEAAFIAGLTESLSPSLFAVDPFPFIMAAFAASIVITAFGVGERLQRDTEGLI